MNPRIKKLAFKKLDDDLYDSILFIYSNEIWILNENKDKWYFRISSEGLLDYNQKLMTNFLVIFGVKQNEINQISKEWFELTTKLKSRSVRRINSDLNWNLEKFKNENCIWDLKRRNGFAYETINRFLTLKEKFSLERIIIGNLKNNI